MKVVLDANVVVSFLLTGGETISSVLDLWERRRFILLISEEILQEVREVTQRFIDRGRITKEEAEEMIWRLSNDAQWIKVSSKISISPDKKDNFYLACAKDGGADFLVTGDEKHLLPLEKIGKTKIVSPSRFLEVTKERGI